MSEPSPREVTTLRRLHALMCRVNAGEDLPAVLQSLVDGIAEVAGFALATVSILHPDQEFEVLAVAGDETDRSGLLGVRTPLRDIMGRFAVAENWGVLRFIPHERLREQPYGSVPESTPLDVTDAWDPKDALLAPLHGATGELVGLLSVDRPHDGRRPGRFAREALDMYAVQAGIAISNAKQRQQAREEIRLAGVVRDVATAVAGALEPAAVADGVVARLSAGLRCDAVWLRTFADTSNVRLPRVRASTSAALVAPTGDVIELAARVAREAWDSRRAVVLAGTRPLWEVTSHVGQSSLLRPAVSEEELEIARRHLVEAGCRSVMLVPVGAGQEFLGYLLLARIIEAASWTAEEVEAALEIGREIGRALVRAQVFAGLEQLDRHKTEMFATVAHELKNPLTAITGHLEMLGELSWAGDYTVARSSLTMIGRATSRIAGLVDDLLVLARVSDAHGPVAATEVELMEVMRGAAEMVRSHAERQGVTLELLHPQGPGESVTTIGEPIELDRVVSNLLSNAVKFSPPGSTVTLSAERAGDSVLLRCVDRGFGISKSDQPQLFTEFFRSTNPAALAVPGTGLGLAIVHRIVTRHGGTIAVDTAVGRGTTFTITLPAAHSLGEQQPPSGAPVEEPGPGARPA